jgi:hypothetical protein
MLFRYEDRFMIPAVNDINFQHKFRYLIFMLYERPVDTFFVIGGLLACWSIMSALDK